MSEENVKKIIFNDESKFNSFCSNGSVIKWRSPDLKLRPGNVIETIKQESGSLLIWGGFSYECVCKLIHTNKKKSLRNI